MGRAVKAALATVAAVALLLAGCGDDDESGSDAGPTDEEQITQVGNEWADLFGAEDEAMCDYLHPDISASCDLFLEGGLTGSTTLQRSFEGATVESVEVDGETAYAEYSTGNTVKFKQDPDGEWKVIETPRSAGSTSDEVVQPN